MIDNLKKYHHEYYLKNKIEIQKQQSGYRLKNKQYLYKYHKKYRLKNKNKILKYHHDYYLQNRDKFFQYYLINKDKILKRGHHYYLNHKQKIINCHKKYNKTPYGKVCKTISCKKTHAKRHRNLGFILINNYFKNSNAHHINKEYVLFIPKQMYRQISHNVFTNKGMIEINSLAFTWFENNQR